MNEEAESEYQSTLDYEIKKRYKEKFVLEGEQIPDPYALPDKDWTDNVMKWPTVLYGDVYNYLIESKGRYTHQHLNRWKLSIISLVDTLELSFFMSKPDRVNSVC